MHRGQAQGLKARRAMREQYGEMFDACSRAMYDADLFGIGSHRLPADEFDDEAMRVVPRLPGCLTLQQVERVLHEELPPCFGEGLEIPPWVLERLSARLWRLMEVHGWR